ncbi:MAG: acetyl-CoA C-acyltransferase [Candidatus Eisenbacteria bacterium]|nr:acetyl-CoA C-acyltransferase [Candidatus Eisenbacteria bacterium]
MAERREVWIAGAARTAIGRYLKGLAGVSVVELGAAAVREAVGRSGIPPESIDEVVLGNVLGAGAGQGPARAAALRAGLPAETDAYLVNQVCGSGLRAVMLGAGRIALGEADAVVAGGMESLSRAPHYLEGARSGVRSGDLHLADAVNRDGLFCAFSGEAMGRIMDRVAAEAGIGREEQEKLALESHRRAAAAREGGRFRAEIVPVDTPLPNGGSRVFDADEGPRAGMTAEGLAKMEPCFTEGGTVTAGTSSGLADGAAAVVLVGAGAAERAGIEPLARIEGYASAAAEPSRVFETPVRAIHRLMERTGRSIGDYDWIEMSEAFAAQMILDGRTLRWDPERVNPEGGAVALGHPLGASGARILVTLLHTLGIRGGRRGLASICLGGGVGLALSVEKA